MLLQKLIEKQKFTADGSYWLSYLLFFVGLDERYNHRFIDQARRSNFSFVTKVKNKKKM